nr:phage tail tape measure protein [uncultured Mediterranean phage uvMED]
MAQVNLDVLVRAKGSQVVKQLQQSLEKTDAIAKKLQGSVGRKLTSSLKKLERAQRQASQSANRLSRALKPVQEKLRQVGRQAKYASIQIRRFNNRLRRGTKDAASSAAKDLRNLALGYLGLAAAQQTFNAGVSRIESERRIKMLGDSYGETADLADLAARSAKRFGQSQTTANQAVANIYGRLRPLGISLKDIESTYNGFNTAARLSGATAGEASAAFTQLSQALGSGVLRGDEFNSIAEQAPALLNAIADVTGVAAGELRAYAAEGAITSEIVIEALKKIESEGAEKLAESMDGPAQKMVDFRNTVEDIQVELTRELIPPITDAFGDLAEAIEALVPALQLVGKVASIVLKAITGIFRGMGELFTALKNGDWGKVFNLDGSDTFSWENLTRRGYGDAGENTKDYFDQGGRRYYLKGPKANTSEPIPQNSDPSSPYRRIPLDPLDKKNKTGRGRTPSVRDTLLATAEKQLGNLAGVSEQCANAIRDLYAAAGVEIGVSLNPYDQSDEQGLPQGPSFASSLAGPEVGKRIVLSDLKPGDLIAFEKTYGNYGDDIQTHVGMYAGDGMMYDHSTSKGLTKRSVDTFAGKAMYGIRPYALEGDAFTARQGQMEDAAAKAAEQQATNADIRQEIELMNKLAEVNDRIREAQLADDQMLATRLEGEREKVTIAHELEKALSGVTDETERQLLNQKAAAEAQAVDKEVSAELAKLESEKAKQVEDALRPYQEELELLEARLAGTEETLLMEREIAKLRGQGVPDDQARAMVQAVDATRKLTEQQDEAKESARQLAGGIAGALTDSLRGLIDGSMSAEEALANAFEGIASAFIDMAMQMIQKWLVMKIMGIFGNMGFMGLSDGGFGGSMGSGLPLGAMSDGGFATAADGKIFNTPTPALVGEGGEPEYVIPQSKMHSAMERYQAGASGEALTAGGREPSEGGVALAEAPVSVNISGGVMQFGGDDYIRKDQIPGIVQQASKAGEQRALSTLRFNPGARKRVGM